jgi:hypothetical protein
MSPTPIPHAHAHHHGHSHGHDHTHRVAMKPPFSLLRMSAVERIGAAAVLVVLLWGAVFWAVA